MQFKLKIIAIIGIMLFSSHLIFAQDVKSVDVKSLPQSDIKKAQ